METIFKDEFFDKIELNDNRAKIISIEEFNKKVESLLQRIS